MNRINFMGFVVCENCNPNGDPAAGNMPRQMLDGRGEISGVALKRRIRDRLLEAGYGIFVQADPAPDGYKSLQARADAVIGKAKDVKETAFVRRACETWIDVRAFGQVFAYGKGKDASGVSIPIRGPVSLTGAISIAPVNITRLDITRTTNANEGASPKKERMGGIRWRIDHGVYQFFGGIYPSLAAATGFSEEDALAIRGAMIRMWDGDYSSHRPEGSMCLHRLLWWEHGSQDGTVNPASILHGVKATPTEEWPYYELEVPEFPGLKLTDFRL